MLKSLLYNAENKLLLPFYHLVVDNSPLYITHLYKPKTIQGFKQDLDVLLNYYLPISLAEVIQINNEKQKLTKPSFHLTFDDGLRNFYTVVAPILLEKGIPATIFLNTDFVDNKDLFYRYKASLLIADFLIADTTKQGVYFEFVSKRQETREKRQEVRGKKQETRNKRQEVKDFLLDINFQQKHFLDELATLVDYNFTHFLETEKPYLSTIQIKELQKQGFTFGAHSANHPLYSELSLSEQLKQTKTSLDWLQTNLLCKQKAFSFPFHDIDVSKQFFESIAPDLDISFGTSGLKKDEISFHLHRLDMEKSNTNTKQFLIKEYVKVVAKKTLGKYIVKRE